VSFAKLVNVHRKTQFNYEQGERKPDTDYLQAIAKAGVDVAYVLTGAHAGEEHQMYSDALNVIKAELGIYNGLHEEWKAALLALRDDRRAFDAENPGSEVGGLAILKLLRRSPFLLWEPDELTDLIERVEFVAEIGGSTLTASQKARAIYRLFEQKRTAGVERVDLAMVKAAIESV
jgi:transcriptional regulator with XRE-family HTH domain